MSGFHLKRPTWWQYPLSRIAIKSLKMLLVAVLIAILNFQIVASFNLRNKKDRDTFCMLEIAGIVDV